MKILVTGSPGIGKTTFSLKLASFLGYTYLNINTLSFFSKSFLGFDKKRSSYIINTEKIFKILNYILKTTQNIILDSHIIECIPNKLDIVIILRYNPIKLIQRFFKKKLTINKILENIEAEFLGLISDECYKHFKNAKIYEIDISKNSISFQKIQLILNGNYSSKKIDWIEIYEQTNKLKAFLEIKHKLLKNNFVNRI